ncbi:MAG: PEP-CTERM sorting domain-containing protein [Chthonomonas sp.]|nr:PEP-CTERM sorting domain-containing protein [Chthonomonas sp.]
MKKITLIAGLSVASAVAFAQVPFTGQLQKRTLDMGSGIGTELTSTPVYSHMDSPYVAFAARGGGLGFDDYTASPNASFALTEMRFIGGVTAAGGQLRFDFFDSASVFVTSFTSTFGTAGNFIWSITGLGALGITLPGSGVMQITALGSTTGQFFLSNSAATVGSHVSSVGSTTTHQHSFELSTVPEPGSMMALLGGFALLARRRRS